MNFADLVCEQVKALPEPLAREVLHFATFLRERQERVEVSDLIEAQSASLSSVWDNAEHEIWNDA
jgi:hypothetical protein